jgi:hypothetical protein
VIFDAADAPVEVDESTIGFGPDGRWRGPDGQILTRDADGNFHVGEMSRLKSPDSSGDLYSGRPADAAALAQVAAAPDEVPASFAVGGLPAFRFNAPKGSLAAAQLETPTHSVWSFVSSAT